RQAAGLDSDFNGLLAALATVEIKGALGIPAQVADALDVLPVDVDFIEGMVAEVGQRVRGFTDGPKAARLFVVSGCRCHSAPPWAWRSMPAFRILSATAKMRWALRSGIVSPCNQF